MARCFWKLRCRAPVQPAVQPAPEQNPLLLALDMIEAAAAAPDSKDAVGRVADVLRQVDESVLPLAAVHLAVLLAHPSSMPRTSPAEVAAWVESLTTLLAFDDLVAPLRDDQSGSEG